MACSGMESRSVGWVVWQGRAKESEVWGTSHFHLVVSQSVQTQNIRSKAELVVFSQTCPSLFIFLIQCWTSPYLLLLPPSPRPICLQFLPVPPAHPLRFVPFCPLALRPPLVTPLSLLAWMTVLATALASLPAFLAAGQSLLHQAAGVLI